ncbi:hypothetical protein Tco_1026114 [Tanacetum coccineum]
MKLLHIILISSEDILHIGALMYYSRAFLQWAEYGRITGYTKVLDMALSTGFSWNRDPSYDIFQNIVNFLYLEYGVYGLLEYSVLDPVLPSWLLVSAVTNTPYLT